MSHVFKAAIAATTLCLSSPAWGATITAVYTGTVDQGVDVSGTFGTAGADLTGLAYSATYVFDSSLGVTQGGSLFGGPPWGVSSPALSASMTINGQTFSSNGPSVIGEADNDIYDPPVLGRSFESDALAEFTGSVFQNSVFGAAGTSYSFSMGVFSGSTTDDLKNACGVSNGIPNCGELTIAGGTVLYLAGGSFSVSGIEPELNNGIPEPQGWALFLVGFGGLGGVLRSARRRPSASPAAP
jgi:hypothetical protein